MERYASYASLDGTLSHSSRDVRATSRCQPINSSSSSAWRRSCEKSILAFWLPRDSAGNFERDNRLILLNTGGQR
jgi:hypothetical protein